MNTFTKLVLGFFALWFLSFYVVPIDSSDVTRYQRSNMEVYIDNLTGCHYLRNAFGSITPRMDKDGKQVCRGYPK